MQHCPIETMHFYPMTTTTWHCSDALRSRSTGWSAGRFAAWPTRLSPQRVVSLWTVWGQEQLPTANPSLAVWRCSWGRSAIECRIETLGIFQWKCQQAWTFTTRIYSQCKRQKTLDALADLSSRNDDTSPVTNHLSSFHVRYKTCSNVRSSLEPRHLINNKHIVFSFVSSWFFSLLVHTDRLVQGLCSYV